LRKIPPADIVLRMPDFWVCLDLEIEYPAGQFELCQEIRSSAPADEWQLTRQIAREYCSVLSTLMIMEEDFRIIDAYQNEAWHELRTTIRRAGAKFRKYCEVDYRRLAYPRDLAVYLPNGETVMCWFKLDESSIISDKIQVSLSNLGEGGRTMIRGDVALYPEVMQLESEDDQKVYNYEVVTPNSLRRANLRTGALLPAITLPKKNGIILNHLDMYSGFLEDPDGQLHLVIDPLMIAAKRDLSGPMSLVESRKSWQEVCDKLGVQLHIPKSPLSVPASVCFFQFPSGKVIMTGGDEGIVEIVADIMGSDKVFLTNTPIRYFPTFQGAGIRCMIGELPPWMRHMERYFHVLE